MPLFCDVALPVPLDMAFTYCVPDGMEPVSADACSFPFASSACRRSHRSCMIVAPKVQAKKIISVLDARRCSIEQLLRLGQMDC